MFMEIEGACHALLSQFLKCACIAFYNVGGNARELSSVNSVSLGTVCIGG